MAIRVLLVDDVPEVRHLVSTALRFRPVFQVVGEAADGNGAIRLASELMPDIVVLDLGLPDLAGREVLTRIRERAPRAKVVIFSGTSASDTDDIVDAVEGYAHKDEQLGYLVELLESLGHQHANEIVVRLRPTLDSSRDARAATREALADWNVAEILDDVLLVVTELVNNAITHAGTELQLRLSTSPLAVRIEVQDGSIETPEPRAPSLTRANGRGMHLLSALSTAWGVIPHGDSGKTVWAELERL